MMLTIKDVVENGLCTGCGACAYKLEPNINAMEIDHTGIYQPKSDMYDSLDSNVCPFAQKIKYDSIPKNKYLGSYKQLWAGYSSEFRDKSSSGGIASWIITQLLVKSLVEKVVCVSTDVKGLPRYHIVSSLDEVEASAQTKYYPLTLESILKEIKNNNYKYAITAIPCFANALALLKKEHLELESRLVFIIGIFCGGMKSKYFTEYLSEKSGVSRSTYKYPRYRVKNTKGTASDYSYAVIDSLRDKEKLIPMRIVGDMWGTGMFKPTVCDYCEDLCAEQSDISLGDAWIPPYQDDFLGTSIVIVRSDQAKHLIKEGIDKNLLIFDHISEDQACSSQQGNINHRRLGLSHRINFNKELSKHLRTKGRFSRNPTIWLVQRQRGIVRRKSTELWIENTNINDFELKMSPYLNTLTVYTRLNHMTRLSYWKRNVKKVIEKVFK